MEPVSAPIFDTFLGACLYANRHGLLVKALGTYQWTVYKRPGR